MASAKDGEFSMPPTPKQKTTSTSQIEKTPVSSEPSAVGPTPNSRKKGFAPSNFMSPTDAMVSPCTQKLMFKRQAKNMPLRPKFIHSSVRNSANKAPHIADSKLANKENEHKAATVLTKTVEDEKTAVVVPSPIQEVEENELV